MKPDWQWNEMQQVGTDYTSLEEVEKYDQRMGSFRDVDKENSDMLAVLNLSAGDSVLEIGCGTGRFTLAAAATGLTATAIDVSRIMLDYVQHKAKTQGLADVTTQHAGFLTMDFPENSFDATVSGAALHHLPDAWKFVALRNIARVLKPAGQFILRDVVFTFQDGESPEECFERFSASFPKMRKEAARHVAQEFSTYGWIMQGLLERAGFEMISGNNCWESFSVYHCRKMN